MRRSTKKAILKFLLCLVLIGCGAYVVLFSGVLNRDKYAYLPLVSHENLYDKENNTINNQVFSYIFNEFANRQLVGKDVSQVLIYDRRDNLINATSNLFCEVHTQDKSIECVSHYILTCKLSSEGNWFFKTFSYDSQYDDQYFPYKTLTEEEIRAFLVGQTLNISEKELTVTNENLLELEMLESIDETANYKDTEKIKVKISSDLLEFIGPLTMSFSFLGSSWNLESVTVGDFTSDYLSNVKPSFDEEDYKKIISQNAYNIMGEDFSVHFGNDNISNIQELSNNTNGDGDVYTQNISFDVVNDISNVTVNAEIVFDKKPEGWVFRKISYTHSFNEFNLCGSWSGMYDLFIENPELEVFVPKNEKNLTKEEKAEKARIEEENANRPSRVKTDVAMVYDITGTDEVGNHIGKATWGIYALDADGNKFVDSTYETNFVGEFSPEALTFELAFDEAIAIGDNYASFDFYYDFATGELCNKTYRFVKVIEEEEVSAEEGVEGEDAAEGENAEESPDATAKKKEESKSVAKEETNKDSKSSKNKK